MSKSMRISDVRMRFFRHRLHTPLMSAVGALDERRMCVVEIQTECGLVGIGESWSNFPSWAMSERYAAIMVGMRPFLLGRDATNVMHLHRELTDAFWKTGLQAGSPGPIAQAISGIDLALWDLAGRRVGLPVFRLLGGGNPRVPLYASALGPLVDEPVLFSLQALGFQAFKLKVGFDLSRDLATLKHLRGVVGDTAAVMVDANQAWTPPEAIRAIKAMSDLNIGWVEEPVVADDCEGTANVARHSSVPIAVGENLYGRSAFARWAHQRACGVAQPDVTKVGGFSEAWVIAHMMRAWNVPYAPHFLGGAVGLMASCHLFAAVPGGLWMEWDSNPNPLRDQIVEPPFEVVDGCVTLSEESGWGIRIREELASQYEVPMAAGS